MSRASSWLKSPATLFLATAAVVIPAMYYYFANRKECTSTTKETAPRRFTILFATTTGTAKAFSRRVLQALLRAGVPSRSILIKDVKDYDVDSMNKEDIIIFLCSTWSDGRPPESAKHFFSWINDMRFDFRVDKNFLEKVSFASFGLGAEGKLPLIVLLIDTLYNRTPLV